MDHQWDHISLVVINFKKLTIIEIFIIGNKFIKRYFQLFFFFCGVTFKIYMNVKLDPKNGPPSICTVRGRQIKQKSYII